MALPKALSADEWKRAEAAMAAAYQYVTADGREVGVVADFAHTGFAAYALAGTTAVRDVSVERLRAAWTRYAAMNKVVAALGVLAAEARVRADGPATGPVSVVATAALTRETLALDKVTRDVVGATQPALRGMQALPSPYLLPPPASEQPFVWRHVETPDACPYYALVCLTPVLLCLLGYAPAVDALMERVARLEPHVYGAEWQERFTAALPGGVPICVPLEPGNVMFVRRAVPVALMPVEGSDFYAVKSVVFGAPRRPEQWRAALSTGTWTADAFDEHFFMRSVPLLKAPPSPPLFAPLARPEDVPWLVQQQPNVAAGSGGAPDATATMAKEDKKRVAPDDEQPAAAAEQDPEVDNSANADDDDDGAKETAPAAPKKSKSGGGGESAEDRKRALSLRYAALRARLDAVGKRAWVANVKLDRADAFEAMEPEAVKPSKYKEALDKLEANVIASEKAAKETLPKVLADLEAARTAVTACKATADAMEDGGGDQLSKRLNAAQATLATYENTEAHLVTKAKKVADALEAANKLLTAYTDKAKRIAENGGTTKKRSRPSAKAATPAAAAAAALPSVDESALPPIPLSGNTSWAPELKHHNAQRLELSTQLKDDARPEVQALLQAYDRTFVAARDGAVKSLTPATFVVDAAPLRAYEAALKSIAEAGTSSSGGGRRKPASAGAPANGKAAPTTAPTGGGTKQSKCSRCERRLRTFSGSTKCRACYFETVVENELQQIDARVDLLDAEAEEEKAAAMAAGIYDPDVPGDAEARLARVRDLSIKITELRDEAEKQTNSTAKYEKMRGLMRQLDGMLPPLDAEQVAAFAEKLVALEQGRSDDDDDDEDGDEDDDDYDAGGMVVDDDAPDPHRPTRDVSLATGVPIGERRSVSGRKLPNSALFDNNLPQEEDDDDDDDDVGSDDNDAPKKRHAPNGTAAAAAADGLADAVVREVHRLKGVFAITDDLLDDYVHGRHVRVRETLDKVRDVHKVYAVETETPTKRGGKRTGRHHVLYVKRDDATDQADRMFDEQLQIDTRVVEMDV